MSNNETREKCMAEMSKLNKCSALSIYILVITLAAISINTTKAINGLLYMIAAYGVFVFVTGFLDKYFKDKTKKMILPSNPCIKDIKFQIETMKCFYVCDKWLFKTRDSVEQDEYKTRYLRHKGQHKHACNRFYPPGITNAIFYRFELLNYYNTIILPSNIPEELKVEWKLAAIESWVIIED